VFPKPLLRQNKKSKTPIWWNSKPPLGDLKIQNHYLAIQKIKTPIWHISKTKPLNRHFQTPKKYKFGQNPSGGLKISKTPILSQYFSDEIVWSSHREVFTRWSEESCGDEETRDFVCLFVCLFVWVKPENLYSVPWVWREVITSYTVNRFIVVNFVSGDQHGGRRSHGYVPLWESCGKEMIEMEIDIY